MHSFLPRHTHESQLGIPSIDEEKEAALPTNFALSHSYPAAEPIPLIRLIRLRPLCHLGERLRISSGPTASKKLPIPACFPRSLILWLLSGDALPD